MTGPIERAIALGIQAGCYRVIARTHDGAGPAFTKMADAKSRQASVALQAFIDSRPRRTCRR